MVRKSTSRRSQESEAPKKAPMILAPDAAIIDKDEEEERLAEVIRSKAAPKRTEEQAFEKQMQDNFIGWTEEELTQYLVDGVSCKQEIKADREKKLAARPKAKAKVNP